MPILLDQVPQASGPQDAGMTDNPVDVPNAVHHAKTAVVAKFGTVLGMAPGDHPCPVYSCDYKSAEKKEYTKRESYINVVNGVFTGYKWQCVEIARRWLLLNKGYVFDSIRMAYQIFKLKTVTRISDNEQLPLRSFLNNSKRRPEVGCLLIWKDKGEFRCTGHVAIVTEVTDKYVRIVEQNVLDEVWAPGTNWSRELTAEVKADGSYWVNENYFDNGSILGWVIQTDSDLYSVNHRDLRGYKLRRETRPVPPNMEQIRLVDSSVKLEAAWAEMNGTTIAAPGDKEVSFFTMSQRAHEELERVSNELDVMFKFATEVVLEDDAKLAHFGVPQVLWPMLRSSWAARKQTICARFDFCLNDRGLKVYEYNADTASCLMECGMMQDRWARAAGCNVGSHPGEHVHDRLVQAWKNAKVEGILHMMQDAGVLEETYHTLYMKSAAEAAGIECKVLKGLEGLAWTTDGGIADQDGARVTTVWKTWAWETALQQLRGELEGAPHASSLGDRSQERSKHPPRLADVLLHPDIQVFEPLWTLIPANKAILPVLWSLVPNHSNLLHTEYQLSKALEKKGYCRKPIAGRCGANVRIIGKDSRVLEESRGRFEKQGEVYQELWPLPKHGPDHVQTCCFTVGGRYAGTVLRADPSLIISVESPVVCLRVVPDDEWAGARNLGNAIRNVFRRCE